MNGETQGEAGTHTRLGPAPASVGARDLGGLGIRRRQTPQQLAEARGPAASLRRDALFRRMLLSADFVAIAGTFVLVTQLSPESLQLTWLSILGLPLLLVGAKLVGVVRPRRDAAAQDDARRGAQAVPAGDALHAGRLARQRTDRQGRLPAPSRSAGPVARAARRAGAGARGGSRACAAPGAYRALPVHRRRGLGQDDSLQADRPSRGEGGDGRAARPRPGRAVVDRRLLGQQARGDPRPRPDARRAPGDHRARQRRGRRDARTWCAR